MRRWRSLDVATATPHSRRLAWTTRTHASAKELPKQDTSHDGRSIQRASTVAATSDPPMDDLKENLLYILIPILIVAVITILILALRGDDPGSDFLYDI